MADSHLSQLATKSTNQMREKNKIYCVLIYLFIEYDVPSSFDLRKASLGLTAPMLFKSPLS